MPVAPRLHTAPAAPLGGRCMAGTVVRQAAEK